MFTLNEETVASTDEKTTLKPGDKITAFTKKVFVFSQPDARNVIHTDEYAKKSGLKGALVEGSKLISHALQMLYLHFGVSWFEHGNIKVSYIGGGALNGDELTAHGRITEISEQTDGIRQNLEIWVENQHQEKVVVGTASCLLN